MQNKVKSLSEVKIGSIVVLNNGNKYIFLGKGDGCVYNISIAQSTRYVGANIGNKITDMTTNLSSVIFKELEPHDKNDWAIRFIYGSLGELIYDTNAREEKVMSIADAEKRLSELLNADVKICDECVNNEVEDIKKMAEACMDYCDQLVSCSKCLINNYRDIDCDFVNENDIRKAYKIINEQVSKE